MSYSLALIGNNKKSTIFKDLINMNFYKRILTNTDFVGPCGEYEYLNEKFTVINTPKVSSLIGNNKEEIITRDYLVFSRPDIVVVILNATTLEKGLNLVFQALEYHQKVIVVVNSIDEAKKKGIKINRMGLVYELGLPIIFKTKTKEHIEKLKQTIFDVISDKYPYHPLKIEYPELCEKRHKIIDLLTFTEDKDLLSWRLLDSGDNFFKSYYHYHPENRINIELLRDGINTKVNHDLIISKQNEMAKVICNKYLFQDS